jgi:ribosomal protein S3AE
METYKLETTVTKNGTITLPRTFEKMFTHRVEVTIKDKTENKSKKRLIIPAYSCGGKVKETNFSREEIYDYRI